MWDFSKKASKRMSLFDFGVPPKYFQPDKPVHFPLTQTEKQVLSVSRSSLYEWYGISEERGASPPTIEVEHPIERIEVSLKESRRNLKDKRFVEQGEENDDNVLNKERHEDLLEAVPEFVSEFKDFAFLSERKGKEHEGWRLLSLAEWPYTSAYTATIMAYMGFYRPRIKDRNDPGGPSDWALCYACGWRGGNWNTQETPLQQHKRLSPQCTLIDLDAEEQPANYVVNTKLNVAAALKGRIAKHHNDPDADKFVDIQEKRLKKYLTELRSAGGLRYEVELHRLSSYLSSQWTEKNPQVSPLLLAKSGFYYLGELDRVKCHFCDNVLRDWEPGDDPASEHERHFPECDFVKGYKTSNVPWNGKTLPGVDERQPEQPAPQPSQAAAQPTLEKDAAPATKQPLPTPQPSASSSAVTSSLNTSSAAKTTTSSTTASATSGSSGTVPTPSSSQQSRMSTVSAGDITRRLKSPLCTRLVRHGYKSELLALVIRTQLETQGSDFGSAEDLIAAYRRRQEQSEVSGRAHEAMLCGVCLDKQACVIFLPCGHLCCCADCSRDLRFCPICRSAITNTDTLNFQK